MLSKIQWIFRFPLEILELSWETVLERHIFTRREAECENFALKVLFPNEIPRLKVDEGKFTGFADKIIEQIAFFDFYRFFEIAYLWYHVR